MHLQNVDTWETYSAALERGEIPLGRAYRPTSEERMIREFVLQLKRGSVRPPYFSDKYGVNVLERFRNQLASLQAAGLLASAGSDVIAITRDALLRVDTLLPRFFTPAAHGDPLYVRAILLFLSRPQANKNLRISALSKLDGLFLPKSLEPK